MARTILRTLLTTAIVASVSATMHPAVASTQVVDDDGAAEVGNCDADTPAPSTIQAGVDAAGADDFVYVCPGLYAESVTVPEDEPRMRLIGPQAGVDARSRAVPADEEAIVTPPAGLPGFSLLASNTVLDGFTVTGAEGNAGVYTSPDRTRYKVQHNILSENSIGLYLHSSGDFENTFVKFNRFENNNLPGSASGNGIYSDQGAERLLIRANSFADHANGAILFDYVEGVVNGEILIENNRSSDDASFVNLFSAIDVRIIRNRSSDSRNIDDELQGSSIRIGGQTSDVLVHRNRLTDPAFSGIAIRDDGLGTGVSGITVTENIVLRAEANGLDVTSAVPGVVAAKDNVFEANRSDGIAMGIDTRANSLRRNVMNHNLQFDCHDESIGNRTAGTRNTWRNNRGDLQSPVGLCLPN